MNRDTKKESKNIGITLLISPQKKKKKKKLVLLDFFNLNCTLMKIIT